MFSRKFKILPVLLAFSLFAGYACDNDDDDDNNTPAPVGTDNQTSNGLSLSGTVNQDARFSTLKTALEKADLTSVLDQGNYTVFAPTNDAFAKIPSATLNALLNDKAALTRVLLYHVVPGTLKADKVLASTDLNSANNFALTISTVNGAPYVNSSKIISTDVVAKNGVIHAIDTVLMPPSLVDIVTTDPRFSTLKAAVVAAGLVDTLKNNEFTIFAPTNEAFAKLGDATLNSVLADKARLTAILLNHVVPGSVKAQQVLTGAPLTDANNTTLTPSVQNGVAYINNAKILQTDIFTTNGVIHAIDTVLVP